jgi:hypothetical protein
MASEDGLFNGLRFTDILFPAAASIASAYNPYIGRGLQTGMNLFNTMANFQQSAQYWKQLKQQREDQEQAILEGQGGLDLILERLREKQALSESQAPQAVRDAEWDKVGGLRFSDVGVPLPVNQTLEAYQTLASPPISEDVIQQRATSNLQEDKGYQALLDNLAYTQGLRGAFRASPAGALSTIGSLGLQMHGGELDKDQIDYTYDALNEYQDKEFVRAQKLKAIQDASVKTQAGVWGAQHEKDLAASEAYQGRMASLYADYASGKDERMTEDQISRRLAEAIELRRQHEIYGDKSSPSYFTTERIIQDMIDKWQRKFSGTGSTTGGGGDSTDAADAASADALAAAVWGSG